MHRQQWFAVICLTALNVAAAQKKGVNHAQIHAGQEQQFKLMDADGDGKVTLTEVIEVRRKLKERVSAGGKMEEFESSLLKKTEEDDWHRKADENSDGHIELHELKLKKHHLTDAKHINHTHIHGGQEQQFSLMDADGNGAVTTAELEEVRQKLKEREAAGEKMDELESTLLRKTEDDSWHQSADENSDGHLTLDEFKFKKHGAKGINHTQIHDRQVQQFKLMDADEDGRVSDAEVAAVRRKLKEREASGGKMEEFESTLLRKTEDDSWHQSTDENSDGHLTLDEFKFKKNKPTHHEL